MSQLHFTASDIQSFEKSYRANLINSVSGFKPANLIGTRSAAGHTNLVKKLDKSKNNYQDFLYYITVFLCYMKHNNIIDYEKFKIQSLSYDEIKSKYKFQLVDNDWVCEFIHYLTIVPSDSKRDKFPDQKQIIRDPLRFINMITNDTIDLIEI